MPPIIPAVPSGPEENSRVPQSGNSNASKPPGRTLALDIGASRIGVAVSDELRVLARGLDTLIRQSKRKDLDAIAALAREYAVTELVVGHPVRLGGEKSAQTDRVEAFAADLRRQLDVPIRLWDERLTSVEATERLGRKRSAKEHIAERKSGAVDRMAAVLILQSYLDRPR